MIRHFIRLLIQRNFKRNSFHTLINILGLSIGLSAFILFVLFIEEVKNYDTFHKNYNSIYRIINETDDNRGNFAGTPAQLGAFLADRVPEINNYTRVEEVKDFIIMKDQQKFFESDLLYVDNSFFEMFSFPIVSGNKKNPLRSINSLVISESMAQKYFGDSTPIGQILKLGENEKDYVITAIINDCPLNSSIKYNFLTSFEVFDKDAYWGEFNYCTYIQVYENVKAAEEKIKVSTVDRGGDNLMSLTFLLLQPLQEMRFEHVRGNTFKIIDRKYILIFLSASIFILFLAIINYTNLASAISLKRSKEVAIKKIHGSYRKQIIFEFLIESIFFSILALFVAFILVELIGPGFGKLISEKIQLSYSYVPLFILLAIIVGILAGIYPAIYGSRYNVISLLKESFYKGRKAKVIRNFLVVVQFGMTGFLLVCSLTFSKQLDFLINHDLGFDTNNIIEVQVHWNGIKLKELKNELENFAAIEYVTTSTFTAGEEGWNQSARWEGMQDDRQISMFVLKADKDFVETLGLKYLERIEDFNDLSFNDKRFYLINESAKKYIGWKESINKQFSIFSKDNGYIAGVVNDFNFRSLRYLSSPSVIVISKDPVPDKMHIRILPGYELEVITFLQKKWKELAPANAPLMISGLNDEFKNLYSTEEKTRTVITLFTIIALIISMLGLFGLATFITLQRTKEIGIRKANGANIKNLIVMLVIEFVKWVFFALIIAIPISFVYLRDWLQNFSYQITLSWWIFALSGSITLMIAFLSVIIQSFRASRRNPIDCLRYE
ncbi:MAG TPA: hypothetical protein DCG75_10260 [Bacteroidales bacterium]|nr:hypothetical protein [Bacteroidales bacterium]